MAALHSVRLPAAAPVAVPAATSEAAPVEAPIEAPQKLYLTPRIFIPHDNSDGREVYIRGL